MVALRAFRTGSGSDLPYRLVGNAIHYKIKESGRYVSKAIYTILGLNIEGKKELLGLYLSDQEGAHHWLSVLTD